MTPICFIDTETTGLGATSDPWEIAIIRRDESGDVEHHLFVELPDPAGADLFALKLGGYYERHPQGISLTGKIAGSSAEIHRPNAAARQVARLTYGAYMVGVNPAYDADVLGRLLRAHGVLPTWDYHLGDLYAMTVGFLNARAATPPLRYIVRTDPAAPAPDFKPSTLMTIPDTASQVGFFTQPVDFITPPWPKSDELAARVGVEPPTGDERHTARRRPVGRCVGTTRSLLAATRPTRRWLVSMSDFDPTNPEHRKHVDAALTDPFSWGDLKDIAAALGCDATREAVGDALLAYDVEHHAPARGPWMQTFTGRRFYPLAPAARDVDRIDIAHALSLICRYGGHTTRFYSVAEHCVALSHAVAPEHALWALLHDATEAYVGDMVRPLKHQMPQYQAVEHVVMAAIAQNFGLPSPRIPDAVKDADTRILLDERSAVMRPTHDAWEQDGLEPLGVHIAGWAPDVAEREYLRRLDELLEVCDA